MLVDYCYQVLGTYEGPMNFNEEIFEIKNRPPQNNVFNNLFRPNLYKYANFWCEINSAMEVFIKNTLLINPSILLSDINQPGLIGFKKWYRNIMETYESVKPPNLILQFYTNSSTNRENQNLNGYPAELTTSFGFFPRKLEIAKIKNSIMSRPSDLTCRLENAKKKRANRS